MAYKTEPFKREHLPQKRWSAKSSHIPVLYNGRLRYICDIHFADKSLCWLEQAKGVPTPIEKLELIISRSSSQIRQEIKRIKFKLKENSKEREKFHNKLKELECELVEII